MHPARLPFDLKFSQFNTCLISVLLLPPATKLGQGNIFRSVCQEFCSLGGEGAGVVSQYALQVVSQHGLQVSSGSGYASMHCRSLGPHPGGKFRGLAWGGLQAHTQGGKLRGLVWGSPGPHPWGYPSLHLGRHPPSRRLLLWEVRILLECILVIQLLRV